MPLMLLIAQVCICQLLVVDGHAEEEAQLGRRDVDAGVVVEVGGRREEWLHVLRDHAGGAEVGEAEVDALAVLVQGAVCLLELLELEKRVGQ